MCENNLFHNCKKIIFEVSENILKMDPDPIPRYLTLRTLKSFGGLDICISEERQAIFSSRWVQQLQETQWADGTWGRFHTQDTKTKQAIPTTETGIALALAYGLDKHDALLAKTLSFIEAHIAGTAAWRDRVEKHDDPNLWNIITPIISAANLALIDDEHPMLDNFITPWIEIVTTAFTSGSYDRQAEITAINKILMLHARNPPAFHTKYPLILLSSKRSKLDPHLEGRILEHILSRPDGVYYLYDGLLSHMPAATERKFYYWLATQLTLARFPNWFRWADAFISDLFAQRNQDGLWEFSARVPRRPYSPLPLSESWRCKINKSVDCSVLILQLLSQYCHQAQDLAES